MGVSGLYLQLELIDGYEMMHRDWSSIVEVPYCYSRSSVKFQDHTALKIVEFDPNWAFPDCNSSLNSPMTMKCCTKLETAKERCPIVFQGHPLNFKVTRYKTSPILTQIGRFWTIGQSQLSNPSDLPCCIWIFLLTFNDDYICPMCVSYWNENLFSVIVYRQLYKNATWTANIYYDVFQILQNELHIRWNELKYETYNTAFYI